MWVREIERESERGRTNMENLHWKTFYKGKEDNRLLLRRTEGEGVIINTGSIIHIY